MTKIKVLRILNRFNVGGPVYNATYLTKYLNSDLYETLLIGGKPEKHEQSADYILNDLEVPFRQLKFMRRAISPLFDLISLIQIVIIIYKYKPNIIHTHAAKSGLLGRLASLFYYKKVKVIHTYHGNVFEGYFSNFKNKILLFIERFLAKKSTKIIAISKLQSHDLIYKYKICEKEKIEIVPLGFDLYRFTENTNSKREKLRKEFNVKDKTILITIIGRIVPIKNHLFLTSDNKTVFYVSEEYNQPYYDFLYKVFGLKKRNNFSYVSHKMLFDKIVLKKLKTELEQKFSESWIDIILINLKKESGSFFSEYEMYGNYLPPKSKMIKPWNNKNISRKDKNKWNLNRIALRYSTVTFPSYLK